MHKTGAVLGALACGIFVTAFASEGIPLYLGAGVACGILGLINGMEAAK